VSDVPTGPFKVVRVFRPIHYDYGYGADSTQLHEREEGNTFRDMALFLDDDERAYVFYASESNKTLYVVRLSDDYTDAAHPAVEGTTWARLFPGGRREAPAPFKVGAKYYMITSGQSGWAPNAARYHVAEHVLGPWRNAGNPVVGPDSATTFDRRARPCCRPLRDRCFAFTWEIGGMAPCGARRACLASVCRRTRRSI
jgi:hypothetical protein